MCTTPAPLETAFVAAVGRGARDLLDEHRARDAAAAGGVEGVLHGDVVVRDDGPHGDALGADQVGGRLEVQDVAGVVLHDVHDAGAGAYGQRGRQDLVRSGRGEHGARDGGVEHAQAHVPAVQRFVSAAAAGDEPDFPCDGSVLAHDVFRVREDGHEVGVSKPEPFH